MTIDDQRKVTFKSKDIIYLKNDGKEKSSQINKELLNLAIQNSSDKLQSSLFVIKSYAQLLQRTQNEDTINRGINLIEESSNKMDNAIQALVSLIQLYTMEQPVNDLVFFQEIYDIVESSLYDERQISKPRIKIEFDDHSKVWFPKEYLIIILREMLSNALLHNIGRDNLIINISSYKILNSVVLEVKDNGNGFVFPNRKDKIRDPFNSQSKLDQCAGVGLSKIEAIVKRTDGTFDIESSIGEGTTCRFYFR